MSLVEKRFSLKTLIYIFILIDLFLIFYIDFMVLLYLIGYEMSLIVGFLIGVRGQGRFMQIMLNLEGIARNKKQSIDEREHRLVMAIHHSCMELGYLANKRNIKYGLIFNNNTKREIRLKEIKKDLINIDKKLNKLKTKNKKGDKKK